MCDKIITIKVPANPGNGAAASLFDSTIDPVTNATLGQRGVWRRRGAARIQATAFGDDQAATLIAYTLTKGSTTWRTAYSVPVPANTLVSLDELWVGDDMKVTIQNGATAPTNVEYSMAVVMGDRAMGA